jgi:hypothetical protein
LWGLCCCCAQIQYLLACDNVKFVECDGVVHIAAKRGKDL